MPFTEGLIIGVYNDLNSLAEETSSNHRGAWEMLYRLTETMAVPPTARNRGFCWHRLTAGRSIAEDGL